MKYGDIVVYKNQIGTVVKSKMSLSSIHVIMEVVILAS